VLVARRNDHLQRHPHEVSWRADISTRHWHNLLIAPADAIGIGLLSPTQRLVGSMRFTR
jgi:hypothetical protein